MVSREINYSKNSEVFTIRSDLTIDKYFFSFRSNNRGMQPWFIMDSHVVLSIVLPTQPENEVAVVSRSWR